MSTETNQISSQPAFTVRADSANEMRKSFEKINNLKGKFYDLRTVNVIEGDDVVTYYPYVFSKER